MVDKYKDLREKYKEGDWVFGIREHVGCSIVFDHDKPNIQPFSYLDSTSLADFRLATEEEIEAAKAI